MSRDHDRAGHAHDHRAASRRALALALALIASFMAVEVVGGLLTGSLALLADAGHMLSDAASLALALGAVWLAGRPASAGRTFGWQRAEVLAALANGVALVVVGLWIVVEAVRRLADPHEVTAEPMLAVAVVGLLVNVAALAVLSRGSDDSLNVSAALRHVIADLLGSAGVIASAVAIMATGWTTADPLISLAIAALILLSARPILEDALRILLEAAPHGVDPQAIAATIQATPGVTAVSDLHVWTITSGFPALSAQVLVAPGGDCHEARRRIAAALAERYGIEHVTIQVDHGPADDRAPLYAAGCR